MKKKLYKICIVGAGWYGCHLGYKLSKSGHNVSIFEKNTDIFQGSSGFNQFSKASFNSSYEGSLNILDKSG